MICQFVLCCLYERFEGFFALIGSTTYISQYNFLIETTHKAYELSNLDSYYSQHFIYGLQQQGDNA
jgi:hypothetical protein